MVRTRQKMKQNQEIGSIHPTIDVCGTQKAEAFDLNTSSKLEESDSGNLREKRASISPSINKLRKNKLYEKHSITGYGTPLYLGGRNLITPCPFCLRSNVLFKRKERNAHSGRIRKEYICLNCKKYHTVTKYYHSKHPEYVIDNFLEIIRERKMTLPTNIMREIYKRCDYKISECGVRKLIKRYNKGNLYAWRIPNSRLNKITKEKIDYIPRRKKSEFDLRIKTKKAINFLQDYKKKIVNRELIKEAGNYNCNILKTELVSQGFVKYIDRGLYYINLE